MDLLKAITGKNPADYEYAARVLVDAPNVDLFRQLVKQEDFLFDFIKSNVANRIKNAINKNNYENLLEFFDYYSPSYDYVIAEALYSFGENKYISDIKNMFLSGNDNQKAYAAKYFYFVDKSDLSDILPHLRKFAFSENEYLSANVIEVLSKNCDIESKEQAIIKLNSDDEFEQYNGVKFLVVYGAEDMLNEIISIMKKSSLAENIASEIPFLVDLEKLLCQNLDDAVLVLCNIVNAIPEIIPPSSVIDYNLRNIFESLYNNYLTSTSALLLRMAKEKFASLEENEEYLFDCDRNTKEEISNINNFLSNISINKLNSLLYDELYEESDFVFFAVDYVNDIEELETLLDSSNQTLLLKVLSVLKEKFALTVVHKELALKHVDSDNIKQIIEIL